MDDHASEFQDFCARLRRNDARLTVLDRSFYYRFCSLLCSPANSHLVSTLVESLAQNSTLEELVLDGGILFLQQEHAASHVHSAQQHLVRNSDNLKHLTLRWCGHHPELLGAVANSRSLKTLVMNAQRSVDLHYLLLKTKSIEDLSIMTTSSLAGLRDGLLQNDGTLRRLHLTAARLRDEDVQGICEGLEQTPRAALTDLKLRVSSLYQATSLRALLLSPNCRLEHLDLSHSSYLQEQDAQNALLQGIEGNTSLRRLVLDQCSLGRRMGLNRPAWRNAFARNSSLQELHLANNFLNVADVETLMLTLSQSPALKELNLEFNLLPTAASKMLCVALRSVRWSKLQVSGLEFSSPADARILKAALLEDSHLQELTLGTLYFSCPSDDKKQAASRAILEGILGNTTLKRLALDGFGTKSEDVRDLLLGLSSNKNLQYLQLRASHFCPKVCDDALQHLIQCNKTLKEVDLGKHESFQESTVQALSTGLRVNQSLNTLRLYQCKVAGCDWNDLFASLEQNTTLQTLDMHCMSPQDTDGDAIFHSICKSLPKMKGLTELVFHGAGGYTVTNPDRSVHFLSVLIQNFQMERISVNIHSSEHRQQVKTILDLNKSGRRLLRSANELPLGAWPKFFAALASKKDVNALFYNLGRTADKWATAAPEPKQQKAQRVLLHKLRTASKIYQKPSRDQIIATGSSTISIPAAISIAKSA